MSDNNGFLKRPAGFSTKLIHGGYDSDKCPHGFIVPGIVSTTTFRQDTPGEFRGYEYGRHNNPTREILEKSLATLDNGKHGLCFSSGLGALTSITSILNSGDHIVSEEILYGGCCIFLRNLKTRSGIDVTFVDPSNPENVTKAIKPNTKMMWMESPNNPLIKVVDIAKMAEICKKSNIILVVDNTFLTPYFQRPLDLGADIVMYSVSKYMNGHTDVIMGAAILNDEELHKKLRNIQQILGVVPGPFDCYQALRGLKTLSIRMDKHMKSSIEIANFLEEHKKVLKVCHPVLKSHPQHELFKKQTYGHSGMMSFYIDGGMAESRKFLGSLKLFTVAPSLGGLESLAAIPLLMIPSMYTPEDCNKMGVSDNLIRLSVGLEDVEDLIQDLDQALETV